MCHHVISSRVSQDDYVRYLVVSQSYIRLSQTHPDELLSLFDDEFEDTVTRFASEDDIVVKVKEDTDGRR